VDEERRISMVEEELKKLLLQSPTALLHTAFGGFNVDRRTNPARAAPVNSNEANIFQGGTMGAGNIMRGFQTPFRGSSGAPGGFSSS
jgi:hypothetical protein